MRALWLTLALAACGKTSSSDCAGATPTCDASLTWQQVQPVFATGCTSCHSQLASQEGVAAVRQEALDQLETCGMPLDDGLSAADRKTLLAYLACH